jgi:Dolichyl-phosphate-mannose-protein mannosyltransferase
MLVASSTTEQGLNPPGNRWVLAAARLPDQIADYLDRYRFLYLFAFSVIYFAGTCIIASRRSIWADEVITAYLNRLSWPQLLPALAKGVDIHPPLFYLITRACTALLGDTPLGLRMPAILGGWMMSVSIFIFMARRYRTIYAAAAMLIPFVTVAETYTYEARSYALAVGFCGVALVCWQSAIERERRGLAILGLGLSVAAALSCHYHMVLMVAALGVGEVVRTFLRKRIDIAVWCALIAGAVSLPLHLSLIRSAMTFTGVPAFSVGLAQTYQLYLAPAILPAVLILLCLAVYGCLSRADNEQPKSFTGEGFGLPEFAVAVALLLSLGGSFVMAKLSHSVFYPRYGLCSVLGMAVVPVVLLFWRDTARPFGGVAAFLVLFVFFAQAKIPPPRGGSGVPGLILSADPSLPVIIHNPLRFLELSYNAPTAVSSRLHYLTSLKEALRYTGSNDDDRALILLKECVPVNAEGFETFLSSNRTFLVWGNPLGGGWLLRKLSDDGYRIRLLHTTGAGSLFMINAPASNSL